MRIALVGPYPEDPARIGGGVAGAVKYLADELVKLPGTNVDVVVPQGAPGADLVLERWANVEVHRLPRTWPFRVLPGTPYDVAAGKRQLARYLNDLSPDVAHFQGTTFLSAGCGQRHVLTIHGIAEADAAWDGRRGPGRWAKRALLKATEQYGRAAAPHVILISEAVRAVLPENRSRRVWRIANPVADSFFAVERRPEAGRVFSCSRLTPLKNVTGLIKAFARAAARLPDARLRVAGPGSPDYLAECGAAAAALGLEKKVEFLGPLSVEEVQEELSRAACFSLASSQENAPLCVAEAMAAGVPVVATSVGGVPEMVETGGTGFLADPRDCAGLGEALSRLLTDPALAHAFGRLARQLARERHLASAVARRTKRVYEEIYALQ